MEGRKSTCGVERFDIILGAFSIIELTSRALPFVCTLTVVYKMVSKKVAFPVCDLLCDLIFLPYIWPWQIYTGRSSSGTAAY